jgi:hypothetical protein
MILVILAILGFKKYARMNHIKIFEEFEEWSEMDLDSLRKGTMSLGFKGHSLYFVGLEGTAATGEIRDEDDYGIEDPDLDEYDLRYTFGVCCKTAEEFYDLLSGYFSGSEYEFNYDDSEEYFSRYLGLSDSEIQGPNQDAIIKEMKGHRVGDSDDSGLPYDISISDILGPYEIPADGPLIEECPFKSGSKMSKYASPYLTDPEVVKLLKKD